MDILKHPRPIKSLILFKLNCHAKMAPDNGSCRRRRPIVEVEALGRRSQRRSSGTPRVQAAETSPSIEDCVDDRTDTAVAQDGVNPPVNLSIPPGISRINAVRQRIRSQRRCAAGQNIQIAGSVPARAADEEAVDVGVGDQLGAVFRTDAATIEAQRPCAQRGCGHV
jgi:hypothetical protein